MSFLRETVLSPGLRTAPCTPTHRNNTVQISFQRVSCGKYLDFAISSFAYLPAHWRQKKWGISPEQNVPLVYGVSSKQHPLSSAESGGRAPFISPDKEPFERIIRRQGLGAQWLSSRHEWPHRCRLKDCLDQRLHRQSVPPRRSSITGGSAPSRTQPLDRDPYIPICLDQFALKLFVGE